MKVTVLFAGIAALAILVGAHSAARYQTDRQVWRLETERLRAEVADLELRLQENITKSTRSPPSHSGTELAHSGTELDEARARLAGVEADILDQRAELVQLKSDRLVADQQAQAALHRLKQQVRKTNDIEHDLRELEQRRRYIRETIAEAAIKVEQLNQNILTRQHDAGALDVEIAELAIKREAARSRLAALGHHDRTVLTVARRHHNEPQAEGPADQTQSTPTGPERATQQQPSIATLAKPAPAEERQTTPSAERKPERPDHSDPDRSKGLYRFKSLQVDREPAMSSRDHMSSRDQTSLTAVGHRDPADAAPASEAWASKQYELGRTLVAHAERNSGTRELTEAVLAFKAVLGEWTKSQDSLKWAVAQNDLGHALALLGQRRLDVGMLEEAAIACRNAIDEVDRGQHPVLWATAHYNLGLTLAGMASIKEDVALWENAIEALQKAVEAFQGAEAGAAERKARDRLEDGLAQLSALKRSS